MKKIIVSLLLGASFHSFAQVDQSKIGTVKKFEEVLTYVEKMYVDSVNAQKLTDAAIVALLEELDPHSTFIPKEEVDDANQKINGSFVGIGIRFQIYKDTLMVVATIPGGPSEKLGIRAGDKITKIEGVSVAGVGLKTAQVREKLMGELGTKVRIEIARKSTKKPLDFVITRDHIPVNSVDCAYMLSDQTGYIKLNTFSRTSTEEVRKSIIALKALGMKNLIFDIQDNGGGLLYTARDLCDEFLSGNKLIVYSEGRAQPRNDLNTNYKGLFEDGRLVILTNENSASASEILSGAIQDWDRGLIIGRRTFGKGLVQRPIDLTDGSQIRLTIARYFTPSGRFIQKPYDNLEAYRKDHLDRYLRGEYTNQDSIKFPDSLKFNTKLKNRTVYGGGGIMPDVFVPLDTTEITEYFKKMIQEGHFNGFTLTYVDKNREKLLQQYPNFMEFSKNFEVDKALHKEFLEYIQKEYKEWKVNEKELKTSQKLIDLRLKAMIAQDIWGISEFYQIYNSQNEVILKALEVIESNDYKNHGIE